MPLILVQLPLSPADLRALADADYTLADQAARTPGLLIAQAPDAGEALGDRRSALGDEPAGPEPTATPRDPTPDPLTPNPIP